MQCPFCYGEVHTKAVLCVHCRSPIAAAAELAARVAELESEIERLKRSGVVAGGDQPLDESSSFTGSPESPPSGILIHEASLFRIWMGIFGAIALISALHLLLLFVYDQPPFVLRACTIAAPGVVSFVALNGSRFRTVTLALGSIAVAVTSVVAMSAMTALIDQTTMWPTSSFEWRELLEYSLAISLGYITGGLLVRAMYERHSFGERLPLMLLLLQRDSAGRMRVEQLAERLNHFFTSAAPVAAGVMGLYSGLRGLLN